MDKLFSTQEAAQYLGITASGLKYHVYNSGQLKGQMVGNSLVFTQEELDLFKQNRQPAGRPKTHKDNQ